MRRLLVVFIFLIIAISIQAVEIIPGEVTEVTIRTDRAVSDFIIMKKTCGFEVNCEIAEDNIILRFNSVEESFNAGYLKILIKDTLGFSGTYETFVFVKAEKKPEIKSISMNIDGVHLSWSSSPGCDGYNIYRNNKLIRSGLNNTQYYDKNIRLDKDYCYQVSAIYSSKECFSDKKCVEGIAETTEIKTFPNPAKNKVVFTGLEKGYKLLIFNISGELVFSIRAEDKIFIWYLLNKAGKKVSSGVYQYVIFNNQGKRIKQGKLAIVK